jgi:hypothetical protein
MDKKSVFSKPNQAHELSRKASALMYELSKLLDSDDPILRADAIELFIEHAKMVDYHLKGRGIAAVKTTRLDGMK